ncbi:unnamed protein product [Mesocestoides corti]|nr:unnamed protein product [Mesocestoides corti]
MKLRQPFVTAHQKSSPDGTMLKAGSQSSHSTNSAFLALQNTVQNCIPVVLPTCKGQWDFLRNLPDPSMTVSHLQRVASDENLAASFRAKTSHLKKVTPDQIRRWETNFNFLLSDPDGLVLFEKFLESEFSQENLQFWEACENYRRMPAKLLPSESQKIYQLYLSVQSPREVNLDSKTRLKTISLLSTPTAHLFDSAQRKIQALMEKDSYQRFLRSPIFVDFKKSLLENATSAILAQHHSPKQKNKHAPPSIQSALPQVFNVTALPLGRKPFS